MTSSISKAHWQRNSAKLPSVLPNLKKPLTITEIVLITVNFVPILGVIFLGWNIQQILLLYWFETASIGFFSLLKMLTAAIPLPPRFFIIPFFLVHFGMFMFGHLTFVIYITDAPVQAVSYDFLQHYFQTYLFTSNSLYLYSFLFLFLSHGFSYGYNYIFRKEYQTAITANLMWQPYPRVVAMHLAVFAGAATLQFFNTPVGFLVPIIILKIIIDLGSHQREHRQTTSPKIHSAKQLLSKLESQLPSGAGLILHILDILATSIVLIFAYNFFKQIF